MIKNNIFPREIETYSRLLREVEKLLNSINDNTKLAPRCLYTAYDPKMMLIFEDLREKGYKVFPRCTLLNYDQIVPVIIKLAKLHAASAVAYEKDPSLMEYNMEGSISNNPKRQDFLVHYRNCARTLGLVAEREWSPEWGHISEKLKNLEKTIIQKGCNVYIRDEKGFNVFNHNDLWVPNLLFKHDEKQQVEDVFLIDFQLSYFGSPGVDLNFLFYGSLEEETRCSSSRKLIKIYHEILSETLERLSYGKSIPSLQDIHIEMLKTGFNAVNAALCEVPLLMYEQSDNLEMDMLLADTPAADAFRYSLFNNPNYKPFIQKLLIEFNDFRYLD